MAFTQPQFEVGQKVTVTGDAKVSISTVVEQYYKAEGWSYKITARYFDEELNDMVDGFKICGEAELAAVPDQE